MTRIQTSLLAVCALTVLTAPPIATAQPNCDEDCFAWKQRSVGPEARTGHAMVYDELRKALVLFGGNGSDVLGDTWEYQIGEWQLRDCSGPAPRSGATMVYDSIRGVTLLFGGYGNGAYFGDTWEWDGFSWNVVSQLGPSPRNGHAMAFDRDRGRVVLFGGYDGSENLAETWEWDGIVWRLQDAPGPPARSSHALSYDERRSVSVMYGGTWSEENSRAVWEWDGVEWRRYDSPSPYTYGVMIYDPMRETSLFFAEEWCEGSCNYGSCSGPCLQAWEWNGTEWTHNEDRDLAWGPYDTAAAYDRSLGVTRVFGGYTWGEQVATYVKSDDLWGLNPDGWIRVESGAPARRWGHAMAFDEYRAVTVLFGGNGTNYDPVGPVTWEWDGSQWAARADTGPSPRHGHAMSYDPDRGRTLLFGGGPYFSYTDSLLWEWNGRVWFPRAAPGPSPRADHAMVFDAVRHRTVLFGGNQNGNPLGDTWEWDGQQWELRADDGPEPRAGHAMVFDWERGVTILFGGVGDRPYGDTWEWDGTSWTMRAEEGPSPRGGHAMVYDENERKTILFGGNGCGSYSSICGDTWAWDASQWRLLALSGPAPRSGQAMVFDAARGITLLLGGRRSYQVLGDSWELRLDGLDDADADGVVDTCDQCPTTPSGMGALENGCTPIDHDLDDDGDLIDYQTLQNCIGYGSEAEGCGEFDRHFDYVIDADDALQLIPALTGPK